MRATMLGFAGALSLILTGATATAASASSSSRPADAGTTLAAVSSTGGATTYAAVDVNGFITNAYVCDTKADGHHAYGEVMGLYDGSWYQAAEGNDYNGVGTCTNLGFALFRNYAEIYDVAKTMEGGTTEGHAGYSRTWVLGG